MSSVVDLSSFTSNQVVEVPVGTVIGDPLWNAPDVTVDDNTVAICRGKMFITDKVFSRLRDRLEGE